MAHLYRLIVAFCLCWVALPASAVIPMGDPWDTSTCNSSAYPLTETLPEGGSAQWVCKNPSNGRRTCGYSFSAPSYGADYYFASKCSQQNTGPVCPPNSTGVGNVCVCTQGYEEVGGACQQIGANADRDACASFGAVNTLPGGTLVQDYRIPGNIVDGAVYCMPGAFPSDSKGCKVTFSRGAFLNYGGGSSITEGTFSMSPNASSIDQSCNVGSGDAPPKVPTPDKCKTGYTGTVNGVEVCVNKVPDSGVGGDKETTEETKDNETKKTTKDSQTECKNGVCTTTTTTTTTTTNNTTGTSTTTTSTTTTSKPQAGFCTENPKSKLCSDGDDKGSSFSGSCSAGFKCEGDAIQCAIAQEQHRRACKLFDDKSPESELYEAEKAKDRNRDVTKDLPGNEEIDVSTRLSRANVLGASSCIGDLSVTVWHTQVTLPLSRICAALAQLGWILVAVSSIAAARIVTKT
jgi:hypothetical protein